MKLIYTCDSVNGKDVTPYTGVAEINQIIGKPTGIIGESNYGLVYRVSVPLNAQYVNRSGISFTSNEGSGMTYAKPYAELIKVTEVVEWKCYMSFYEKLIDVINDDIFANKSWCKKVDGELVIDIRDSVYEPWHYENWYYENWCAGRMYANGERKEYRPKRCSIKTVVKNIEE